MEPLPKLVLGRGSRALSLHHAGSQLSSWRSPGALGTVSLDGGWMKGAGVAPQL